MKKSILLLPFIFLLSLVLPAYAINCAFVTPLSSGSLGNLTDFNVSIGNAGTTETSISIFVNASSPSTRNSTNAFIGSQANITGSGMGKDYINISLNNSVILEDSDDYTFSCACQNSTIRQACNSTSTSVLVDRTAPSAPSAITFTNPLLAGNTITSTIDRTNANRCWIQFGGLGTPRNAMTLSGSTCTYTVQSNSPPNSDYQAFLLADDRTNQTASSVQSISIKATTSDGGGIYGGTAILNNGQPNGGQSIFGGSSNPLAPKSNSNQTFLIIGIIIFILWMKKKK